MLNNIAALHPAAAALNSYESIQTVTVGAGGQSSIDFTSIPSTYKHLQIRGMATFTSGTNAIVMQNNSDTGSNYMWHQLYGTGSTAGASAASPSTTFQNVSVAPESGTVAGFVVDILDYGNTSKYKTSRSLTGYDNNGSGVIALRSGLWMNTNAITSLTLKYDTGANFANNTKIALYGIKG
jgi:hypothetical protein